LAHEVGGVLFDKAIRYFSSYSHYHGIKPKRKKKERASSSIGGVK
jgi:hypothetical protein